MLVDEYEVARELTNYTINLLDNYFINHTYSDKFFNGDLEFLVMLLRGFLQNYETISIDNIRKALTYMHKTIFAHTEVVYTYEKSFYDDFFYVMDKLLGKFYFDVTVMRANIRFSDEQVEEFQESLSDIMQMHKECMDEFMRVLLLKMSKVSFTNYDFYHGQNIEVFLNRTFS